MDNRWENVFEERETSSLGCMEESLGKSGYRNMELRDGNIQIRRE